MKNADQFDAPEFDDEWIKQFVDDPFILYDETIPIDLYETSTAYILEADLTKIDGQQLSMTFLDHDFILAVKTSEQLYKKTLLLPFFLNDKQIETEYQNQILAIKISKETNNEANYEEPSFSFNILL
ncbi:Hsp20/alpha crystallin family protein [Bacillus changyiensis]|uniref:Hsp20/alpha crystallin family protein n=1 Tax=Bacillus changyiensis TaxID=3004103 RepID=UPI0022E4C522|nr:Hsp20/alpha crystallin family protein [Bacillus changyiensis]MDA1475226.1 Hsp20/alpha crystallin family protein [Bacillus changyiensis]